MRPSQKRGSLRFSVCRFVERRVERVEVAAVQSVLQYAQTFAESLVMNKLSFAQEFDRVAHVGIVREAENVIVGQTRFLLCREVFRQVCYRVAGGCESCRRKRRAACRNRINARGVVDEIIRKRTVFISLSFSPRVS